MVKDTSETPGCCGFMSSDREHTLYTLLTHSLAPPLTHSHTFLLPLSLTPSLTHSRECSSRAKVNRKPTAPVCLTHPASSAYITAPGCMTGAHDPLYLCIRMPLMPLMPVLAVELWGKVACGQRVSSCSSTQSMRHPEVPLHLQTQDLRPKVILLLLAVAVDESDDVEDDDGNDDGAMACPAWGRGGKPC